MNLTDYIESRGGTGTIGCAVLAEIAKSAGCKSSTLYMISLGHKQPSWKLAVAIQRATAGVVGLQSLRSDAAELIGPMQAPSAGAA